ncbi:hypothetical protein CHN50_01485 [Priestia aryabhattai]|nr:hypothetical protein CHN50_01485 [Priestia aryabhattai]
MFRLFVVEEKTIWNRVEWNELVQLTEIGSTIVQLLEAMILLYAKLFLLIYKSIEKSSEKKWSVSNP